MPAESLYPTLASLLRGIAEAPAIPIAGIASDSRRVGDGYLFLACPGIDSHGMDHVDDALIRGVAAVAYDASTAEAPSTAAVPFIGVPGLGGHIGEIANRYFRHPSDAIDVVGVTGTNGKTTVAWMIAQCLGRLDRRCAYGGTLGFGIDEVDGGEGMTTPAAVELHERLADFVAAGASHAALEVSSHALAQSRVDGVRFSSALFTNLTRDHLDYHGSMRAYFECKSRLFFDSAPARCIVDIDTDYGEELATRLGAAAIVVSTRQGREKDDRRHVFVRSITATDRGSDVSFVSSWGDGCLTVPLPGVFNVANAALVLAWLLSEGVALDDACWALEQVEAPPGRMQRVGDSKVYVDYAHTPDAIDAALRALRPHCRGELWCLFGAGGDRDAGKRPLMAASAEAHADRIVLTSDNPRGESPAAIIDDIVAGLSRPEVATVIDDRATAIAWAVARARAADTVLIAGKGHETHQEIGGRRLPFSDYAVAAAAVAEARR